MDMHTNKQHKQSNNEQYVLTLCKSVDALLVYL
jgi:hypothetical protein